MDSVIKKLTKKLLPAAALLAPALLYAQGSGPATDGIAAVVNDKVITFSEVRQQVAEAEHNLQQMFSGLDLVEKIKEARLATLKALIDRQLIIQDFAAQGFFLPDNIVEDQMKKIIADNYGGDRTAFIKTLQAQGSSLADFKENLKNRLIVDIMRGRNVSAAVIVSPYQIEQYYQDNIRQFVEPDQIRVRAIFMRRALFKETRKDEQGNEIEVDPRYLLMRDILLKVDTGSDFANLARSYSEGTQQAAGGDLGWVTAASLRKELADVAFKLRPGQNSQIIETEDGYYILKVEEIKKSSVLPLAQVRDGIEAALLLQERERLSQDWLDGLRAKAFIKMFF